MYAFTKWKYWLEGVQYETVVYSNHDYLLEFLTNKVFTKQQRGWYIQTISLNYKIYYKPRKRNRKVNILSKNLKNKSQNHSLKMDLQNIEFLILKLLKDYLHQENVFLMKCMTCCPNITGQNQDVRHIIDRVPMF